MKRINKWTNVLTILWFGVYGHVACSSLFWRLRVYFASKKSRLILKINFHVYCLAHPHCCVLYYYEILGFYACMQIKSAKKLSPHILSLLQSRSLYGTETRNLEADCNECSQLHRFTFLLCFIDTSVQCGIYLGFLYKLHITSLIGSRNLIKGKDMLS